MNIKPVYELHERLHMAAIAGVNLLQEDFRLRRVLETFGPLETASPVFAKIGQLTAQLLSPDCQCPQLTLLDAITLLDAVICTFAEVELEGKIETVEDINTTQNIKSVIINAPYSQVKGLIEALTQNGSGHYDYVEKMHNTNSEIFKDYRVRYAMVKALGASYVELAELVQEWLFYEDDSIILLLKKNFNPKGKMEMMRRLEIIGKIAGAKENDFYREMLADSDKNIRMELIRLLRLDQSNVELLLSLAKTEKGKNREAVIRSLGYMDDDRVIEYYEKLMAKDPEMVCEYLLTSTSKSASKIVARLCMELLERLLSSKEELEQSDESICAKCTSEDERNCPLKKSTRHRFCKSVEALIGKSGNEVIACYQTLLANKDILEIVSNAVFYDVITTGYKGWNDKKKRPWEQVIGMHLASSFVLKDNPQIVDFVMEQVQSNIYFLTAASLIKLCKDEHCTKWFDEQLKDGNYAKNQFNKLTAIKAALQYVQWDALRHAYVAVGHTQEHNEEVKRTLEIPDHKAVLDWIIQAGWDELVYNWTNKDDAEECAKVGEWFYERCLAIEDGKVPASKLYPYLEYMQGCKWMKCQGLARVFATVRIRIKAGALWQIQDFFQKLSGDTEAILAELDAFIKLAEEKTISGMDEKVAAYCKVLRGNM